MEGRYLIWFLLNFFYYSWIIVTATCSSFDWVFIYEDSNNEFKSNSFKNKDGLMLYLFFYYTYYYILYVLNYYI